MNSYNYYTPAQNPPVTEQDEKDQRRKEVGDLVSGALTAVGTEELTAVAKKSAKLLGKKVLSKAGVNAVDADDIVEGRAIPLVRRNVNRLLGNTSVDQPRPPTTGATRQTTKLYNYEDVVNDKDLFTNYVENEPTFKSLVDDMTNTPEERSRFIEESRQQLIDDPRSISSRPVFLTTDEPVANAEGLQPGYRVLADVDGRIPHGTVPQNIYGQPLDLSRQATVAESDADAATRAAQTATEAGGRAVEKTSEKVGEKVGKALTEGGEDVAEIPDVGEVLAPLLLLGGGVAALFHKKHNEEQPPVQANPSQQFLQ